ncbi:glucuronate isomerase [Rhizobium sp. Root73]|uniref:glucuronate isomerase n=1 Tax=unclassified Rhizobium TaxID=2613769 RepID=UPI0007150115|nr:MULTISPECIES: glucuronate isomerase [unclassified Rhizobium]KQV28676.1 glucuronate isomerase [Rhizobium sp. Root1204]KQY05160.1 glucuronate isomerase [Rhizobium sp. Root1334]KRC01781.1 glucuronate isomerase [Rhizobium sp. Root73]
MALHPDRLFPADPGIRAIARQLYETVAGLPIVSPHGHTDPSWYAEDKPFPDPAALFITPDHYATRMLYSQGVRLEDLGVPRRDGAAVETDPRKIWRLFAAHFHLFAGTPTRIWFEHSMETVFGITERLSPKTADALFDRIEAAIPTPEMRPRALFDRFGIEVIATTDGALEDLRHHDAVRNSGWHGRVVPTYRPDAVVDPQVLGFAGNLDRFLAMTGEAATWSGYLNAHRARREFFKRRGATATDHGHATARTENLSSDDAARLFDKVLAGKADAGEADAFRGQMLTEMARMSRDDGLVMQIHPGSYRNHNPSLFADFGPDKGADIPQSTNYVQALKPLLDAVGNDPALTVILFTLDETAYSRELAPLAGHYPALKLGPAWWFFDSPEGMRRYRETTTETAGFYNTVGFNDDTRAYLSIPARHDMARRVDCAYLARLVADHRIDEDEASTLAHELAYGLAKRAYRL